MHSPPRAESNGRQMHRTSIGQAEKTVWQAGNGGSDRDAEDELPTRSRRGDSDESGTVNQNAVNHRPTRRYKFGFMLLLLSTAIIYIQFFYSPSDTQISVPETPENMYDPHPTDGKYGINALPDFANMIKVQNLDTQFVPKAGKDKKGGRLIIVGDVHGMKLELIRLLDKVSFNKKRDHLILVGDLITKGPDSLGVIDLAMELQASAVRGNHEDRVLLAYDEMKSKHVGLPGPYEDPATEDDDMEELSYSQGDYEDQNLAKSMSEVQIAWLKKLPVILRVGKIEGMGEVVVVHAGLVAGVSLEEQDPFHAMNMRTIDMHSHVPSEARDGTSWCKLWNRHQKTLPKDQRSTVIYGHDSKRGLQIEEYTKGIDTGCRKGHKLTALVIQGGAHDVEQHIVQLKCGGAHHKTEETNTELKFEE